jgi:hypothetical protein
VRAAKQTRSGSEAEEGEEEKVKEIEMMESFVEQFVIHKSKD